MSNLQILNNFLDFGFLSSVCIHDYVSSPNHDNTENLEPGLKLENQI